MKKLLVTLVRSTAGSNKNQLACLQSLGLKKINEQVLHEDNDAIRGVIRKVEHLVTCEEVEVEDE